MTEETDPETIIIPQNTCFIGGFFRVWWDPRQRITHVRLEKLKKAHRSKGFLDRQEKFKEKNKNTHGTEAETTRCC